MLDIEAKFSLPMFPKKKKKNFSFPIFEVVDKLLKPTLCANPEEFDSTWGLGLLSPPIIV